MFLSEDFQDFNRKMRRLLTAISSQTLCSEHRNNCARAKQGYGYSCRTNYFMFFLSMEGNKQPV